MRSAVDPSQSDLPQIGPLICLHIARLPTVGQKPAKAAKTLGIFRLPESLNSARIESMTPSMDSSLEAQSIKGVTRSIRALFDDAIMVETCPEFWPPSPVSGISTVRRVALVRAWPLSFRQHRSGGSSAPLCRQVRSGSRVVATLSRARATHVRSVRSQGLVIGSARLARNSCDLEEEEGASARCVPAACCVVHSLVTVLLLAKL